MLNISTLVRKLFTVGPWLMLAAANAQASFGGSVFFQPVAASAAAPVPVLTDAILVVLGLFLCIVAVRTLRQHASVHKMISFLVLGTGLAIGGLGVDRVTAGAILLMPIPSECSVGGSVFIPDVLAGQELVNDCANAIRIESYELSSCGLYPVNDSCPVGTELAPNETCTLNHCPLQPT